MRWGALFVLSAAGCTAAGGDSGAVEPADLAPCDAARDGSTGDVVGVITCADGRCAVPAGPFWMGSANPEQPDECPVRSVQLSGFTLDQTEVTHADWTACVTAGACAEPPERCRSAAPADDPSLQPVSCVTFDEAAAYCAFRGGRLPTEAEWEKAARGEQGARFAWGALAPTCNLANHRFVSSYCELGPVEVGAYPDGASAYGALDMAGNVWEWVADAYDAGAYRDAADTDPVGPDTCRDEPDGVAGACRARVIRGGAWNSAYATLRGAERAFAEPEVRDDTLGFRCVYAEG